MATTAVDTLRQAATLMRERAQAATPGPWEADVLGSEGYAVRGPRGERRRSWVARCGWESWDTDKSNAAHIASWHPAVALAVADLLDEAAAEVEFNIDLGRKLSARAAERGLQTNDDEYDPAYGQRHALAVARAYLGEAP